MRPGARGGGNQLSQCCRGGPSDLVNVAGGAIRLNQCRLGGRTDLVNAAGAAQSFGTKLGTQEFSIYETFRTHTVVFIIPHNMFECFVFPHAS